MNDAPFEPTPVTVLTGFLGSGKTTLLARLLTEPAAGRIAVIVNELGEIALDHHLLRQVDERTLLLDSGCICCALRDDLVGALRDLVAQRERGAIPDFDRVVIETTGLADPAPIVHSLMRDPLIGLSYRLDGLVTLVDAVTGAATLDAHEEAVKQAAMADRLLLTKTDIAEAPAAEALRARLRTLNPAAPILSVTAGAVEPAKLFNAGLYNAETKSLEVRRWLAAEAYAEPASHHHHHSHDHHDHAHHDHGSEVGRHDANIHAYCLTREAPFVWDRLAAWIETLTLTHGANILRLKGIVNLAGEPAPVALHGVQHLFHPPVMLEAWPDNDRRSKLVLIVKGLGREELERGLDSFTAG